MNGKMLSMTIGKDCGVERDDYHFTNDDNICDYCWAMRGGNQMDTKLTMFPDYINWVEDYADNTFFQAKLYDEPSPLGIDGGRVSKLHN